MIPKENQLGTVSQITKDTLHHPQLTISRDTFQTAIILLHAHPWVVYCKV